MPTDSRTPEFEAAIDRRIDAALGSAGEARIPMARAVVDESDDRWYGRVLARSYCASKGTGADDSVLQAAAAIELLRAYCRLRGALLVRVDDAAPHSSDREPTTALLAGDFLYAAAYSALGEADHAALGACYRTLTDTSTGIVRTFYGDEGRSASTPTDPRSLFDGTAGRLGRGAAVVGATLAGVDGPRRDDFGSLGRGLSAARQVRLAVEADGGPDQILPQPTDTERLREHAARQSARATEALDRLEPLAGADRLRSLFEDAGAFER